MQVYIVIDNYGNHINENLGTIESVFLTEEEAKKYIEDERKWTGHSTLKCVAYGIRRFEPFDLHKLLL